MKIVVLGGSGFIGRQVVAALRDRGHMVQTPSHRELDFMNLNEASAKQCFAHQEVMINCIGVMSRHAEVLETVHHHAPAQLAAWAQEVGVARWVQLSALGADPNHAVAFVGSRVTTLGGYLDILRRTLHGKPPLRILALPLGLIRPLLPLGNVLTNGVLSRGSFALLEEGSCADVADFAKLLGRSPLAVETFAAQG